MNNDENKLYKIIKQNYNIDFNELSIEKVPLSYFEKFKDLLANDSYFEWDFCIKFFEECNKAYHIKYKNVSFYILTNKEITKKIKGHLYNSIYRVFLIKKLFNIKPEEHNNYYILLNPLKRKLPDKKGKSVGAVNVNGGFTYINSHNIYIVRKEDYEKVIIHELLHHNRDIHFENWSNKNVEKIRDMCRIDNNQVLIPNEAIIETYAIIINVIFYSIENNMTFVSFKKIIKEDREHNIKIAKKILDKQGNNKWYEKTHSYCYIVLRAIFYIYFKEFIKIYRYNNDDDMTEFILKYYPKILKKIKNIPKGSNNNYIKQTIFNNF